MNYYNDCDPDAVAWLEELIARKEIPEGKIDQRSITDVLPTDLSGFNQCHFFAGIGGWPLALKLARVSPKRRLFTGSCPCPPFSSAGKKKLCPKCGGKPIPHPLKTGIFACVPCGHEWLADGRHLYPEFLRLIIACRPSIILGEQVAGADGLIWMSGVRATLEALGYDLGIADLCAPGVGAPHIRQRLYWGAQRLADTSGMRRSQQRDQSGQGDSSATEYPSKCERSGGLAYSDGPELNGTFGYGHAPGGGGSTDGCGMGHPGSAGLQGHDRDGGYGCEPGRLGAESTGSTGATGEPSSRVGDSTSVRERSRPDGEGSNGKSGKCVGGPRPRSDFKHGGETFWSEYRLILCRDGKHRRIPIEPALFPLADGVPYKLARRGSIRPALLKGAGNAIAPELAAQFIEAFDEAKGGL